MSKITEFSPILGAETDPEDLFVTVHLRDGDLGTKKISRSELAKAIQLEVFSDVVIEDAVISDPTILIDQAYNSPLNDNSYFMVTNTSGETVKILYSDLQNEISESMRKVNKIYVDSNVETSGNGSYYKPLKTLEEAFSVSNDSEVPVSITVLPGIYYTNGSLELPDNSSIVSTNGQYMTTLIMNDGYEETNCILVGSGSYVQGFSFANCRVDDFDNPTGGFAIAFRPGALITRSPYIRDISQISNYRAETIAAPLDPVNGNPLVGRGGGVLLADRSILNQNSIFPYMLAFGATPRSVNGLGYVAKNGAGINGISSITIFQRNAFYALNGGQITLNNSGTQFGDISMRAKGSIPVVEPYEISESIIIQSVALGNYIESNKQAIIDSMWSELTANGYIVDETFTRRDSVYFLDAIKYDFLAGKQTGCRNFVAGLFDYKGDAVFDLNGNAGTGRTLIEAFTFSFNSMKSYIITNYNPSVNEESMLDALIQDIILQTLTNPSRLNFGSLVESLGHQFNLAGAGVNKNALPLNFRRVGEPRSAASSVLQEDGGRVRWSGADELNNQYFARGLRVNGKTGRLEGRPFTSSVRRLARRAANSRVNI